MVEGKDFDQVWAGALRSSSARALFAYAARFGCGVHSIDWVAAYLQGELQPGEVVYYHMPPGYEQVDPKTGEQAYQAWLGFYNSQRQVRWGKPELVQQANRYAQVIGLTYQPALEKKTIGKMGLKGVPGLRFA